MGIRGGEPPRRPRVVVVVARDTDHPHRAGGDRHVCLLAEALAERGCEVAIWSGSDPSLPEEGRLGGARVERIAPVPLLGPAIWRRLLLGQAGSADLVVEEVIGGARIPFLAPLLTRRPVLGFWYQDNTEIFRAHYGPARFALARAVQAFLLLVHRRSDIACPSGVSRAWLVSRGFSPDRVGVFYPSVDVRRVPAGPPQGFGERRDRIVCVGNFRPLKRYEEAIEMLARVRRTVPGAELVLIGRRDDAAYLSALQRRAEGEEVRGHVDFRLDIPDTEKYALLGGAKLLTIHSAIEGFGLTIAEAGLVGVPAIGNDGVPGEVLEDGVNGSRVATGDVGGFAGAATRLLTDADAWGRLSTGALAHAGRFRSPRPDAVLEGILGRLLPVPREPPG